MNESSVCKKKKRKQCVLSIVNLYLVLLNPDKKSLYFTRKIKYHVSDPKLTKFKGLIQWPSKITCAQKYEYLFSSILN